MFRFQNNPEYEEVPVRHNEDKVNSYVSFNTFVMFITFIYRAY